MPLTPELQFRNGLLHQEGIDLQKLAGDVGTPFYCYSKAAIESAIHSCRKVFDPLGVRIHYAVKANSNLSLLKLMAAQGLGADIVSGGELERSLRAGIEPASVIFSGVGKRRGEIARALDVGIGQFNVESIEELSAIEIQAIRQDRVATVAVRINPDVDAKTHRNITTGLRGNKFGIPLHELKDALAVVDRSSHLRLRGLAVHIGSQINDIQPYRDTCRLLSHQIRELRAEGTEINHLDLGGGFGVDYGDGRCLDFEAVAGVIERELLPLSLQVSIEPGRSLVAPAGIVVSRVIYRKEADPPFIILDAGMNDLMRPALYQAVHPLLSVSEPQAETLTANVVGPICESSDTFEREAKVPDSLQAGELVVLQQAGAYAAVMAGTYNSRDLIPEILVDADEYRVIRQRLTQQKLMELEV